MLICGVPMPWMSKPTNVYLTCPICLVSFFANHTAP